jgi:hypothetical protein
MELSPLLLYCTNTNVETGGAQGAVPIKGGGRTRSPLQVALSRVPLIDVGALAHLLY